MPQSGMDWWVVAGVVVAALGVYIGWRQLRGGDGAVRTTNKILNGNRNIQTGGKGSTDNTLSDGNDNSQSGA